MVRTIGTSLVRGAVRALWMASLLLALVAPSVASGRPHGPADTVLRGGALYTLSPAMPWAEAIAIAGERIVFVGTNAEVSSWIGPKTHVVDLAGKMVLPGFHDTHVHPIDGGLETTQCRLYDFTTPDEVVSALRDFAGKHPSDSWLRGTGWQLFVFPDANPSKTLLDQIAPDRPAFVWAADGHSAWVNSKALAAAGVTRETPDPPNGRIERDANKEPSGTLRESAADLVAKLLPDHTDAERLDGLRAALKIANAAGITSLYEAHAGEQELRAYSALDRSGELTARIRAALGVEASEGVEQVARLETLRRTYTGPLVHPDAAKMFADGVIEAKTAYLLEPYVGAGANRGTPNYAPKLFTDIVAELDRKGFQVHVHAIGDGAVREALDAFEHARTANGVRDSRHVIAHLELIDPADVARFRRLGVVADFQPLWAYRDEYITKLTEPFVGPDRSTRIYPIGSIVRSGAAWSFGSDWPVTPIAPLEGIQVAVTRRSLDAGPGDAWLPDERIGLPEAIAGYTSTAAYADFEDETGTLVVGKIADVVVLERNLFDLAPSDIHADKIMLTMLAGKDVYRAPEMARPSEGQH